MKKCIYINYPSGPLILFFPLEEIFSHRRITFLPPRWRREDENCEAEDSRRNLRRISWWQPRVKAFTGGKGAKGRHSALNVSQPRRKAKLQRVQSTVPVSGTLLYAVSTCVITGRAISRGWKANDNKRENRQPRNESSLSVRDSKERESYGTKLRTCALQRARDGGIYHRGAAWRHSMRGHLCNCELMGLMMYRECFYVSCLANGSERSSIWTLVGNASRRTYRTSFDQCTVSVCWTAMIR